MSGNPVDDLFAKAGQRVGQVASRVAYTILKRLTDDKKEVVQNLDTFFIICISETCATSLGDEYKEKRKMVAEGLAPPDELINMTIERVMEHPMVITRLMTLEERKRFHNQKSLEESDQPGGSAIILPFGKGGGGKGRGKR